jgi:hypothetical protein
VISASNLAVPAVGLDTEAGIDISWGVHERRYVMGIDLKLANRVWRAAKRFAEQEHDTDENIDYYTVLMTVCALLRSKALAQVIVDESWEKDAD